MKNKGCSHKGAPFVFKYLSYRRVGGPAKFKVWSAADHALVQTGPW